MTEPGYPPWRRQGRTRDNRQHLRRHFEVNAESIAAAALSALAREKKFDAAKAEKAKPAKEKPAKKPKKG